MKYEHFGTDLGEPDLRPSPEGRVGNRKEGAGVLEDVWVLKSFKVRDFGFDDLCHLLYDRLL